MGIHFSFAKMPAVTRRLLLESLSSLPLLSAALLATSRRSDAKQSSTTVYELRIYNLNEGKQPLILERFRSRERVIFARCGMHGVPMTESALSLMLAPASL